MFYKSITEGRRENQIPTLSVNSSLSKLSRLSGFQIFPFPGPPQPQ